MQFFSYRIRFEEYKTINEKLVRCSGNNFLVIGLDSKKIRIIKKIFAVKKIEYKN